MSTPRNRLIYSAILILIIALGLLSRQPFIPAIIYPYIGDAFYAMMIYILLAIAFNKSKSIKIFAWTIALCYLIELSQLYQADWINAIRNTQLGGLILGFGFLWSDLVSYFVGATIAFFIENSLTRN